MKQPPTGPSFASWLRQGSAKFVIDTQLDGSRKGADSQYYLYRPQPNPSSSANANAVNPSAMETSTVLYGLGLAYCSSLM